MRLPPALESFARLPLWNILFLLLAVGVILFSGWSAWRRRRRQDLLYLLLGFYLMVVQLPIAFSSIGEALHVSASTLDFTPRFLLALPAMLLFVLAVRAR